MTEQEAREYRLREIRRELGALEPLRRVDTHLMRAKDDLEYVPLHDEEFERLKTQVLAALNRLRTRVNRLYNARYFPLAAEEQHLIADAAMAAAESEARDD